MGAGGSHQRHIPHSHMVKSQIMCDTNPAQLNHTAGEASHGNIAVTSRAVGVVTEVQVPSACSVPRWLLSWIFFSACLCCSRGIHARFCTDFVNPYRCRQGGGFDREAFVAPLWLLCAGAWLSAAACGSGDVSCHQWVQGRAVMQEHLTVPSPSVLLPLPCCASSGLARSLQWGQKLKTVLASSRNCSGRWVLCGGVVEGSGRGSGCTSSRGAAASSPWLMYGNGKEVTSCNRGESCKTKPDAAKM